MKFKTKMEYLWEARRKTRGRGPGVRGTGSQGTGSRSTGSWGVENTESGGKHGVWKTRSLVESTGSGGKHGV